MERTLDLHAKIAASSPEHRERIERSLFADAEYPGCLVRCLDGRGGPSPILPYSKPTHPPHNS